MFNFEQHKSDLFLIGAYRSDKSQLDWILNKKIYNVRSNADLFVSRDGYVSERWNPQYVLIYNCADPEELHLFSCGVSQEQTQSEMEKMGYPQPEGSYLTFKLGREWKIPRLNITDLLLKYRGVEFSPFVISGEDILPIVIEDDINVDYPNGNSIPRTYISLFSSAGVGCYGFKMNGYECIATNELLEDRLAVQKANHKCRYESGYIGGDITLQETQQKILDEIDYWKHHRKINQIDVLFATPPCQGMSTANYKKSDDEQIRNSLVVEAIRMITKVRPKIFIFENVRAFMKTICTDISGDEMSIKESIYRNLSEFYHIHYKVINFKDYGVPSSRPRTIVIGTDRNLRNLSPLNLFPTRQGEITLRQAIGDLPALNFGQKDNNDFLHFARPFPEYQLEWVSDLREGQSAFDKPVDRQPYKFDKDGNRVLLKGAYMGNKYKRLTWDRPCACIATRNDQLASQETIHPRDNRVLSIRELMRLMTIPDTFRWTVYDENITPHNSDKYLSKYELNIRRCIGEAVPTHIIHNISAKIKSLLDFQDFVSSYSYKYDDLRYFLHDDELNRNFYIHTFLKEQEINEQEAKDSGSFYTPQSVVYDAIKDLNVEHDNVRILEPSAGLGAFLPQVCSLFSDSDTITIDAVEINEETIATLQESLNLIELGENVHINFIHADFLEHRIEKRYDVVVTNPPYAKAERNYPDVAEANLKIKNLFALFLRKLYNIADEIACVIPKNFLMADEFLPIRTQYQNYGIVSICDFGVKYFKKVFVEIISIHFRKSYTKALSVTDYVNNRLYLHKQGYIFHDRLWLIYRNEFFDQYICTLRLNVFGSERDRQITNSMLSNQGKIRVLRSKNIQDDGSIVDIAGYDKYINDVSSLRIGRYLNSGCIIMPTFTYNTRASILPPNTVPNGSIAVLIPNANFDKRADLRVYSTPEFREYYGIVKSYSKFTLNIDNCSVYYIGIKF